MKQATLTEGPVKKTIINMTIPMIFGMLGMVAFNLADTYFIGQLGTKELAAISFTFPVIMVIMNISIGVGIGATAVVSRAIGSGNGERVQRLTTDAMLLALLLVIFFGGLGMLTMDPLFTALGAQPDTLGMVKKFMLIWYSGTIFVILPMVGNSIIRATGDTKTPSYIMLVAVIVNIILDPLLIFGIGPFPRLELEGAAYATLISRLITFIVAVWVLVYRDKMVTLHLKSLKSVWKSWKEVMFVGIPSSLSRVLYPIGIGVIISIVAMYGEESVAAFGVASRIEFFAFTVMIALAMVVGPFVGQNFAAKKPGRITRAIRYSEQFSIMWGLLIFVVLALLGKPIASVFNNHETVINVAGLYLLIVPICYGFAGIAQIVGSALNVLNRPYTAAALIMLQMFIFTVPLAYLGSFYLGLLGVIIAITAGFTLTGIISHFVLKNHLKNPSQSISD